MLIRTSGVKRFSDFLLWQVHFCPTALLTFLASRLLLLNMHLCCSKRTILRFISPTCIGLNSDYGSLYPFYLIISGKYGRVLLVLIDKMRLSPPRPPLPSRRAHPADNILLTFPAYLLCLRFSLTSAYLLTQSELTFSVKLHERA